MTDSDIGGDLIWFAVTEGDYEEYEKQRQHLEETVDLEEAAE